MPTAINTYRGRFAPSPTGPLHFGSLVAALASFLDARYNNGHWLVRMEDLDPPREIPGASDAILRQLESHHLSWDEEILLQSNRSDAYREALDSLADKHLTYNCNCPRQRLRDLGGIYDGRCSTLNLNPQDCAIRLRTNDDPIEFEDQFCGIQHQRLQSEVGDFVLHRRDGLTAYQLAVVVDDHYQNITHVLRGADLLDSTTRQIYLQRCLDYPTPGYGHIPLALNDEGQKLSKQNLAQGLPDGKESNNLWQALDWLRQDPPVELRGSPIPELLAWGVTHWNPDALCAQTDKPAPDGF